MNKLMKRILSGLIGLVIVLSVASFSSAANAAINSYIATEYPQMSANLTKGDLLTITVGVVPQSGTPSTVVGALDLYLYYDVAKLQFVSMTDLSPNNSGATWSVGFATNEAVNSRIKYSKGILSGSGATGITVAGLTPVYKVTFRVIGNANTTAALSIGSNPDGYFFKVYDIAGTNVTGTRVSVSKNIFDGFTLTPNSGNIGNSYVVTLSNAKTQVAFDSASRVKFYDPASQAGNSLISVESVTLVDAHTLSLKIKIAAGTKLGSCDAYVYKPGIGTQAFQSGAFTVLAALPPAVPVLYVAPTTLPAWSGTVGQTFSAQSFIVKNTGEAGSTMVYTIEALTSWIYVAPLTKSGPITGVKKLSGSLGSGTSITIYAIPSTESLTMGDYHASIRVTAVGATNSPKTVSAPLHLEPVAVKNPKLSVSQSQLNFAINQGDNTATAQAVNVSNTGDTGSSLTYSISYDPAWLTVAPTSGTLTAGNSNQVLFNIANAAALTPGTYESTATVNAGGVTGSPASVKVVLTVKGTPVSQAALQVDTYKIDLNALVEGANPDPRAITISNGGGAGSTLNYTVTKNANWLSVDKISGSLGSHMADTVTVSFDKTGLKKGTYYATIEVTDPSAINPLVKIPVTLVLTTNIIVTTDDASLEVSPTTFTANETVGQASSNLQNFLVKNGGPVDSILKYTVSSNKAWLLVNSTGSTLIGGNANWTTGSIDMTKVTTATTEVGIITIDSGNAIVGAKTVRVTLNASLPKPVMVVTPSSVAFDTYVGVATPEKTITIANNGPAKSVLNYTATTDKSWLKWSNLSTTTGTVTSGANVKLGFGVDLNGIINDFTDVAYITITPSDPTIAPFVVPVSLMVHKPVVIVTPEPVLVVAPDSLSFTVDKLTGIYTAEKSIIIANTGNGKMNWTLAADVTGGVNWLSASASSGSLGTNESVLVKITANGTNLTVDELNARLGTITVFAPTTKQVSKVVNVSFLVKGTPIIIADPQLSVTPSGLNFVIDKLNGNTQDLYVTIANIGTGYMPWTLAPTVEGGINWITASVTSGTLATNESIDVKITANAADLTVDAKTKRNGTITVSAPSSKQPIKTVSVGLIVQGKPNTPVIDHLSPETGLPGTKVTVYGEGFGDQMFSELRFGGVTIEAQTWTDTQIEFIVPKSGFPAGSGYDVTVTKKQLVGTEVLASDASEPKIFKVVALSGTTKVFPNPFDPNSEVAKIEVVVSTNTNVSISIYDITGLLVWKKDAAVSSGTETIEWTGRDMYGRLSGDGVYLVRVMDNDSKVLLSKGKILVVKR